MTSRAIVLDANILVRAVLGTCRVVLAVQRPRAGANQTAQSRRLADVGMCPCGRMSIWTEDTDFFGAGVATSTTAGVELFFTESDEGQREP